VNGWIQRSGGGAEEKKGGCDFEKQGGRAVIHAKNVAEIGPYDDHPRVGTEEVKGPG